MEVAHSDDLHGGPGYYLKGGFDPRVACLSEEEALMCLRMRKGVKNHVTKLFCPYTGKPLQVIHRGGPGVWVIVGDHFSPRRRWQFKEDLLYAMSFRGGRKPGFPKPDREKVTIVENFGGESNPTEGLGSTSDEVEEGLELLLGD